MVEISWFFLSPFILLYTRYIDLCGFTTTRDVFGLSVKRNMFASVIDNSRLYFVLVEL